MTQAAILIQSKFRSYHEQKKFQQSRRAAVLIQQYYRSYKEFGRLKPHHRGAAAALVQHKLRYTQASCWKQYVNEGTTLSCCLLQNELQYLCYWN